MQKHVNLVDLVKSFPTNMFLQNLASIQKRTGPLKFAHLAEKSENGSVSNLSTKLVAQEAVDLEPLRDRVPGGELGHAEASRDVLLPALEQPLVPDLHREAPVGRPGTGAGEDLRW